jgi:hypothetical protein
MMNESGVDFGTTLRLQNLCIDNEKIRQRIKQTKEIEVNVVPCILTIFASGGVEKYDGSFAFKWTESMITQLAPPPPPKPVLPPPPPPQPVQQQPVQEEEEFEYEPAPREPAPLPPRQRSRRRKKQAPQRRQQAPPQGPPSRMRRIKDVTSVDELQFDEEETDRHRLPPPTRRIRQDQGGYIEDDSLFDADQVQMREIASAIKSSTTQGSGSDIMARAQAMQQNRDSDEQSINPQQNRPPGQRRP